MLFHKKIPGKRFQIMVQIYLPAEWFNLEVIPIESDVTIQNKNFKQNKSKLWIWIIGIIAVFYFIVKFKHKSISKAIQEKDEIDWGNLDWTPPQLNLSHYHIEGKICTNLNPLEAAFYLEIPFKKVSLAG